MTTTPETLYRQVQQQRDTLAAHLANLDAEHRTRRTVLRASEARSADAEHQAQTDELRADLERMDAKLAELGEQPAEAPVSTRSAERGGEQLRRTRPAAGATLGREERMADWAVRTGQVPEEHHRGERPLSFAKYMRGAITGDWRDADLERRAMSEGVLAGGGYMVPTILSSQIIDAARNRTRVLQAGAQLVPMANATVDLARWAGDPAATWHSENALVTASDATLARVRLQAKALMSLVVVARELVEDATPDSVEAALRDAFAAQFALTIDSASLYGTGVAPQPTGVKTTSGVTVTPIAANGQALANWDPVVNAVYAVRNQNEEPTGIIYSGRTAKNLALLKDTTNQPLRAPDYLDGIGRYETQQVPNNLTVGTSGATTSDIFVADWRQLLVGVRTDLQITPLRERYAEYGQVAFVAWWRGDIAVARTSAFAVTTGIL